MSMNDSLSKPTLIFGLRLWVIIVISSGAALLLLSIYIISRCKNPYKKHTQKTTQKSAIPNISKEIQIDPVKPDPIRPDPETHFENGKCADVAVKESGFGPGVSHLGWGHWYTLRELEESTDNFDDGNVIGSGGYGIVYRASFGDGSFVAVKNLLNNSGYRHIIAQYYAYYREELGSDVNLLNNRGQAEKEFKVEVEAIGRVRHKNLVRLLGYCVEGAHRMLVYEYVNNGNLEQWLHGDVGPCSPLTWDIRMNIILGTAKGLTYLHEGLEPKVVHRDIKSSNILLDEQWNAKLSDFGLAKLLGPESYVTTRVMGTFGYVAPEYASTGMLNERSDVYSFGILIMEIISGRNPVDYSLPPGEVNLVEWLKMMVTKRNAEGVLDPKLQEKPPSRTLKRALLVALRCVDPNAQKRPKMGHVIHMLEADDFPFRDDRRGSREHGRSPREIIKERLMERGVMESGDSSGYESGAHANRTLWKKRELRELEEH